MFFYLKRDGWQLLSSQLKELNTVFLSLIESSKSLNMLLSVQDLCIGRSGQVLLADVSFRLDKGQALILKGRNGLGKTTLLRVVVGLQPAISGQIHVEEDTLVYVAHADGVKPSLTVAENVEFWGKIYGNHDIDRVLSAFDLNDSKSCFAGLLSAGQRRRLGLARMLISNRPVWVLDEPLVSLDTASTMQLNYIIEQHLQNGGAALIVTHSNIVLGPNCKTLQLDEYKAEDTVYNGQVQAYL